MNRFPVRRLLPALFTGALLLLALILTACNPLDAAFGYQGRLLRPNGALVADGNYNVVYKLYRDSTGGTPVYTETKQITVRNLSLIHI